MNKIELISDCRPLFSSGPPTILAMKGIIWLLFIVSAAAYRIKSNPFCQNGTVIAGANIITSGFNAKTGEILGLPIWVFNKTQTKFWSPTADPQCIYLVPDLMPLIPLQESEEGVVQSISASYLEYLEIYASYYKFIVGIDAGAFAAAFAYSKELMDIHYHLNMNLQVKGSSYHWWHIYKLTSYPAFMLDLDGLFAKAIDWLPTKINSTESLNKYTEVVRAWGTHNPSSIDFGASIRIHDFLDQSLVKDFTLEVVIQQMGLLFYLETFDIFAGGFINRDEIIAKLNVTFVHAVNRTTFFSGGASILQTNETLKQWLSSVPYYPAPQSMVLREITDFIQDKEKSQTWSKFVSDYLKNSSSNAHEHILDAAYYLGHGVNSAPSELSTGGLPWFDYHFSDANIWEINGVKLTIPDEIYIIPRTQSIWSNLTIVIQNGSDYQSIISNYYSDSGIFSGSTSQLVNFFERFYLEKRNLSLSDLSISFGKAVFPLFPQPKLSDLVVYAIDKLYKCVNCYQTWKEFFETLGTGVIDSAEIGGRMQLESWSSFVSLGNRTVEYLWEQSGWSFFGIIGDGEGHISFDSKIDSSYISSTRREFSYRGGTIESQSGNPNEWHKWAYSIPQNMIPIAFTTVDIDEILKIYGHAELSKVATIMLQRYLNESATSIRDMELKYKSDKKSLQTREDIKGTIEALAKAARFTGARIGIGWNVISSDMGLPIFKSNYSEKIYQNTTLLNNIPYNTSYGFYKDILNKLIPLATDYATIGFYSSTESLVNIFDKYFAEDTSMSIQQERRVLYKLLLNVSDSKLDEHFQAALDVLPIDYDAELYGLIIKYWGTNVIVAADVGGAAEQIIRIRNCVWNLAIDLSLEFHIDLLATIYPADYSIKSLNTFYLDHRQAFTSIMIGGDPTMADPSQWKNRTATLDVYPALISVNYTSYLTYISNNIKRANLERAIREAVNTKMNQRQNEAESADIKFKKAQFVYGFGSGDSWWDFYGWRIPDFWLGSQINWNMSVNSVERTNSYFGNSTESSSWWQPMGYCERNTNGMLRARSVYTNRPEIGKQYHPISSKDGPYITSGCSTATQVWDCNNPMVCPTYDSPATLRIDCCLFCVPKIVPVCNYRFCGFSLKACDCPKF
ncbi:MAG: MAC/perforin domain protein [Hyperionvirus sp.]|uniref:MAC/perforin domain protein n=1 Tax=Hyperionvirus sp. TaxID=2487770 RepID=A0A3G5AAY6_9VIRU|nr:MAG: MAC/perforin domain protein [Hyperionvirus sp.]